MKLWTYKYQPEKLSEVISQSKAVAEVYRFWQNFKPNSKRAALLHGPPGCGKTSLIYALAAQENLEIVEINASDFRNREQVEKVLKPATQQVSIFGAKKIILVDEVDGMSGQKDRGGVPALIEIIKETKFPIFITANDAWSDKLRSLRNHCILIGLNRLNYLSVAKYLREICKQEDVECEELALKKLAISCNGDLRAALNDLQAISAIGSITEKELIIWGREQDENVFNALKLIFKSFDSKAAKQVADGLSSADDLGMWLEQNIPAEYSKESLSRAFDAVSWSNIFEKRIRRWQHWRFLVYVNLLLVAGVQQAKKDSNRKFVSYKRPGLIFKMWQRAAKRKKAQGLADQIAGKLHCSTRVLQKDFLPYFNFIEKQNPEMYQKLADSLGI